MGYNMCDVGTFNKAEIDIIYRSYFARKMVPVCDNSVHKVNNNNEFTMMFFIMLCEHRNIDYGVLHSKLKGYVK